MDVDPPGSSDIEGELEVADTPTSSQGALGEDDTSCHEGDTAMDTSDNEVVVIDGKYTPSKVDKADMPVTGSLHHTGTMKADRKGKRKAVAEDLQGAMLKVNSEAASGHVNEAGTAGAAGSALIPGSVHASGSGPASVPVGGPSTTHPVDLMGEIAEMLDEDKITTENVQANFQQLVCFLPSMIFIYILITSSTQNSNWTISPGSNSAYHLITASTNIQKDLARTTGVLKQLLEVDKILSEATRYADDALEKLEGLKHNK
jgi:hypothetical protein